MKFLAAATAMVAVALMALPILNAQDLPEGKGKDLVKTMCAQCHGLEQVVSQRTDKDGWDSIVAYMVSRGMSASDDEYKTMVEYLTAAFPPAPTKGK